jgi:multiple antibiotic resistance protein
MASPLELFLTVFAALFPIMNPFGNAAIFHSLTLTNTMRERRDFARRASIYAVAILLVFFVGGSVLIKFFGISIDGIRIAGGLVITRFGFAQLNPRANVTHPADEHAEAMAKEDIAFSPLAMPLMAGPGAIAAVMTASSTLRDRDLQSHLVGIVSICIVGASCWLILRYAESLMNKLGVTGARALTKIMGFLLLCMGVQLVIDGVRGLQLFGG